jgi:hypothetical protein
MLRVFGEGCRDWDPVRPGVDLDLDPEAAEELEEALVERRDGDAIRE